MKFVFCLPRALWKIWFAINFVLTLLLLYPLFFILLSRESWFAIAFRVMRMWAKWLCYAAGIIPSITIKEKIPKQGTYIFVSNHTSYLDIPLAVACLPHYFIFVAKQELDKLPLFRIFFKQMNILVNRKSAVDSHRAYQQAAQKLDTGQSVYIFPEATISSSGKLIPFKNGAFKLAIDKQIPIVPITYLDNWKILQNGGLLTANGRPGMARVIIHSPIVTKGMSSADLIPLREKVKAVISTTLEK
jgi:1-acyl-sn-glycerol-3-phosphate acyltransferase